MTTFDGFADKDMRFFKALAKHQDRDWFLEHKSEFQEGWQKPMMTLLGEARSKLDSSFPHADILDPKIFRLHRDVRFSKDKSPYKTHIGGLLLAGSKRGQAHESPAALYVQLGTECMAAAGQYGMQPDALVKYRRAVDHAKTGPEVAKLVTKLEKLGYERGSMGALKRVPKGFDPEHPRGDLLKLEGLVMMFPPVPKELIPTKKILSWLTDHAKKTAPLVEWLVYATA